MSKKKISIIGSGVSSLAAAAFLAKAGHEVDVFEKNSGPGGRARSYEAEGFRFDMGPSWFWMPDVFERFYNNFNLNMNKELKLERLDPSYKVYFDLQNGENIPAGLDAMCTYVESIEEGAGVKFLKFMKQAEQNYNIAVKDVIYQPGASPLELVNRKTISRLPLFFKSIQKQIHSTFKSERLRQLLCFPVLFLGARPQDMPAFYNFMNHADTVLGTWYPEGGFYAVIQSMVKLCMGMNVKFHYNAEISAIHCENNSVKSIETTEKNFETDIVLSGADYHHTETLLDKNVRQYSEKYWSKKIFAPSSLLFYVGFDKKIENVSHHTLFFDSDFDAHAKEIYDNPQWPTDPLFYANFTSITDKTSAPEGKETGFFLIPLAPGIEDTDQLRETYFHKILDRFEQLTNQEVKKHVLFKKSFCVNDFKSEYNSYKGNAYGMANTLLQTAFLRPNIKSSKVKNLYFTGQLTVPGPGVPPALISGKIASELIIKNQK